MICDIRKYRFRFEYIKGFGVGNGKLINCQETMKGSSRKGLGNIRRELVIPFKQARAAASYAAVPKYDLDFGCQTELQGKGSHVNEQVKLKCQWDCSHMTVFIET